MLESRAPRQRMLTPSVKTYELMRWAETMADFKAKVDSGEVTGPTGGLGYPDPEIYPLVHSLNVLEGIVTMQSCSGHRHDGEGEESMWSGQLWIAMCHPVWSRYINHVDDMLAFSDIERASLIFLQGEMDVADIIFQGLNKSEAQLERSGTIIYNFFEGITSGGWFQ